MKLTSVHIREYKSVQDSGSFNVGDVTCLVGKNEAGKTALLESLYRLNPIIQAKATFDVTEDYPRSQVEQYNIDIEQKKRQHATVVSAVFTLQPEEMQPVKDQFGEEIFRTPTVRVSRGYSNQQSTILDIDEQAAVRKLVDEAGLPAGLGAQARTQPTLKQLASFLSTRGDEQQRAFTTAQTEAGTIEDPQEKAKALDEANKLAESEASKQLRAVSSRCLETRRD